jgi:hypothetical protein
MDATIYTNVYTLDFPALEPAVHIFGGNGTMHHADALNDSHICILKTQSEPDGMKVWNRLFLNFETLERGWNGYDAPPPAEKAMITAKNLIATMLDEGLAPNRVTPSVVGGIGITKRYEDRKVYFEIQNDGKVYALFSDGVTDPQVIEVVPGLLKTFRKLLLKTRNYLDGRNTGGDEKEQS